MSIPNNPDHESEGEDDDSLLEEATVTAELALVETRSGEVEELNPTENGQELTSGNFPDVHFLESKQCTNIVHCRDVLYIIINTCFGVSRFIESYYRHDDVLAVNNDLTRTLSIFDLLGYVAKLTNEVKRDLKEKNYHHLTHMRKQWNIFFTTYGLSQRISITIR